MSAISDTKNLDETKRIMGRLVRTPDKGKLPPTKGDSHIGYSDQEGEVPPGLGEAMRANSRALAGLTK